MIVSAYRTRGPKHRVNLVHCPLNLYVNLKLNPAESQVNPVRLSPPFRTPGTVSLIGDLYTLTSMEVSVSTCYMSKSFTVTYFRIFRIISVLYTYT